MIDDIPPGNPRRTPDVAVERTEDGAVLRLPGEPPVSLNPTALALWELCDGSTTVDEMIYAVCALFSVGERDASADVEDALRSLHRSGLLAGRHGHE